jgi:hypothetical protein
MRGAWLALALAGCPICPDGSISGPSAIAAGTTVELQASYGDWRADTSHCGAFWYVNGQLAGDATDGTIDTCGRYTAPATPPGSAVHIEASQFALGQCSDCCPYAAITLRVQ